MRKMQQNMIKFGNHLIRMIGDDQVIYFYVIFFITIIEN